METCGIQCILNSLVFNVVPTVLEIGLVAYIPGTHLLHPTPARPHPPLSPATACYILRPKS